MSSIWIVQCGHQVLFSCLTHRLGYPWEGTWGTWASVQSCVPLKNTFRLFCSRQQQQQQKRGGTKQVCIPTRNTLVSYRKLMSATVFGTLYIAWSLYRHGLLASFSNLATMYACTIYTVYIKVSRVIWDMIVGFEFHNQGIPMKTVIMPQGIRIL